VKMPVRLIIYCLMPTQRRQHLRMALRGLWDGWRGKLGRFDSSSPSV